MFPSYNVISITNTIGTAHRPLRVLTENYEEYILKHPGLATPEYRIVSEFLCSALLQVWNLKTPEVAVLLVNPDTVDYSYEGVHQRHYFNRPCFGSKILKNVTEFTNFKSIDRRFFKKLTSPLDYFKLALFDLWVENDDRRPSNSNLLLQKSTTGWNFVAIDHAFTFSTRRFTELNPNDDVIVSENDSLLHTVFAKKLAIQMEKQQPNYLDNLRSAFYLCIAECSKHFTTILNAIPSELGLTENDTDALGNFLFSESRNQAVFIDFCRRLKP